MRRRSSHLIRWLLIPALFASATSARSQGPEVAKGVEYLKAQAPQGQPGEAALAALAMTKAGVSKDDPEFKAALGKALSESSGNTYIPGRSGGPEIYETGIVCILLAELDATAYLELIRSAASQLLRKQKSNGAWDYEARTGDTGDCSISQYAVLGLWEAENAGVRVHPSVWERAARWYMSTQRGGGWTYHPDEGRAPTVSMTAAGVGSLLICKRQLAQYRKKRETPLTPLLVPLVPDTDLAEYRVSISDAEFDRAIGQGIAWISGNFRPGQDVVFGPSTWYGLYGCERVGALAGLDRFNSVDWYNIGGRYIVANQGGNGGWADGYGTLPATSWNVLFLTRATKKSLQRIAVERLGSGTLLGGRGLPEDLENLTIAGGRVMVKPMNGAVEEMLAVLEDPRAEGGDSALAGLVERYATGGPLSLRPYIDRFRVLLAEGDPEQRLTAAWALARTGEIGVASDLIDALEDPDDQVVATSEYGLRLLGRRLEGFGPEPGASAEQKEAAADRWRQWLESIRPPELVDQLPQETTGP